MEQFVAKVTQEFIDAVEKIYAKRYPDMVDEDFQERLDYFKFCVYDDIFRCIKKHDTFIFNTNFRKDFAQNNRQKFSLSAIVEAHLIDIFHQNYDMVLGPNMNIVVFGNKDYAKMVVEGFHNGKKKTFKEVCLTNGNEQTI
ncbi:MAG: hypothetical protein J6Q51_04605 [Clostridia bacterium]|nr:hypothetical protein [Clostridia bacterium]